MMGGWVAELALYFNEPARVAKNNMDLQIGGDKAREATDFFKVRNSLGINGYMSMQEAVQAVKNSIAEYARNL